MCLTRMSLLLSQDNRAKYLNLSRNFKDKDVLYCPRRKSVLCKHRSNTRNNTPRSLVHSSIYFFPLIWSWVAAEQKHRCPSPPPLAYLQRGESFSKGFSLRVSMMSWSVCSSEQSHYSSTSSTSLLGLIKVFFLIMGTNKPRNKSLPTRPSSAQKVAPKTITTIQRKRDSLVMYSLHFVKVD